MPSTGSQSQLLVFEPVSTLASMFTLTPEKRFIFILGPIGSTKTTTCLMWLMCRAATQAPGRDNLRFSRFAIVRNTLAGIKQTVLRDIRALFGPIVDYRVSENLVRIEVGDIRAEFMFMPLETPEDQRRLLSLQLSGVYVNEAREVDFDLMMAAFSRTGRYPSPKQGGAVCSWRFLLADSNMGVEGSKLHQFLEERGITREDRLILNQQQIAAKMLDHDRVTHYIHQPSALATRESPDERFAGSSSPAIAQVRKPGSPRGENPAPLAAAELQAGNPVSGPVADWLQYLPQTYYQDAMVGATQQWVSQHVRSQWGLDLSGMPVYGQSFIPEAHIHHGTLYVYPGQALIVGFDPGLNPAMVVSQLAPNGQLRLLAELFMPNLLFREFVASHCMPLLQGTRFGGCPIFCIMDPAGRNRTALSKDTALGVVQSYGLSCRVAYTNDLAPRLRATERWLMEMRGAATLPGLPGSALHEPGLATTPTPRIQPALLVDPGCFMLIEGFMGKYRYLKKPVTGELSDKPEKKHPISDVQDCFQYICLALSRKIPSAGAEQKLWAAPGPRPAPSKLAWT